MMLRTCDLNLAQFGDPAKEAVKRTMLQHEIVFKNQVRELHRLYWTQKNLMREFHRREQEASECRRTVEGSAREGNVVDFKEVNGRFGGVSNRCRGFDLELPPDVCVVDSAKNSIGDEPVIGSEMASGFDEERRGEMIPRLDKGKSLCSDEAITLEEPAGVESNAEAHRNFFGGFKVPAENCIVMGGLQSEIVHGESGFVPCSSLKAAGFVPDLNHSHFNCNEIQQENKADHSAAGGSESSVAGPVHVATVSMHKPEFNSSKPILFDLNIPQDEETCHVANEPILTFSSQSSSSSVVQNELLLRDHSGKWIKEAQSAYNSEASLGWLFPASQDSQRSRALDDDNRHENETCDKVQESDSTGLTQCFGKKFTEGFSSDSLGNTTHSEGKLTTVNLVNNNQELKQANHRKSEDTVLSSIAARDGNQQAGSVYCSSLEKIMGENSETTQLESTSTELSLDKICNVEEQHDQDIAAAAEILACISLSRGIATKEVEDNQRDQPQCSSDSFEAMTLDLPEVISEDHSTPPTQIEVEEEEAPSRVNRLRRGRGRVVRDFQKDILPGMVSLSRHEICEDMHSIGYELRKNGLRRTSSGSWFSPVRCRRSRRGLAARRQ